MPPRQPSRPKKSRPWISRLVIASSAELRAWLEANCTQSNSIWLVTYRKTSPDRHVPYDDVVEEALCFGWVDSLSRKVDVRRNMLLLSPRRRGSSWSRVDKERAERLITRGLMQEAGFAKIKEAMKDGSWDRLDRALELAIPTDFAQALGAKTPAAVNFEAFPATVRRAILTWINAAKRVETRAKRIAETAELAAKNVPANQWRQK